MKKEIVEKMQELNLEKIEGFKSWVYKGDSYLEEGKDEEGKLYCVINSIDNKNLKIQKGEHLYKVITGDLENEVYLVFII